MWSIIRHPQLLCDNHNVMSNAIHPTSPQILHNVYCANQNVKSLTFWPYHPVSILTCPSIRKSLPERPIATFLMPFPHPSSQSHVFQPILDPYRCRPAARIGMGLFNCGNSQFQKLLTCLILTIHRIFD